MLIAIDIGNTNITFGVFNTQNDSKEGGEPFHNANIQTNKNITTDELAIQFVNLLRLWNQSDQNLSLEVIISSVVPQIDYEFSHMFEKYFKISPYFVKNQDVPLRFNYDSPEEIGADRFVNGLAGINLYPNKNLIIVDFGTATTFDVISKEKVYEGGIIVTGIMTSLRALEDKASKLPHIDLLLPSNLIGKKTVEGIRSGIIHGNGAMVDELVRRIAEEMNWKDCFVIATGGLAKLIKNSARSINCIDPHLTLKGLFAIWKLKHA